MFCVDASLMCLEIRVACACENFVNVAEQVNECKGADPYTAVPLEDRMSRSDRLYGIKSGRTRKAVAANELDDEGQLRTRFHTILRTNE